MIPQKEGQGKEVIQEEDNLQYYKSKKSKRFKEHFLRKEIQVLQEVPDQNKKEIHQEQEQLENPSK